jgi:hypothetical protein
MNAKVLAFGTKYGKWIAGTAVVAATTVGAVVLAKKSGKPEFTETTNEVVEFDETEAQVS